MSLIGMLFPPSLPHGWVRFEAPETPETWDNGARTDEVRESNRLREAFPAGAHPTAGAPFAYLEDETR